MSTAFEEVWTLPARAGWLAGWLIGWEKGGKMNEKGGWGRRLMKGRLSPRRRRQGQDRDSTGAASAPLAGLIDKINKSLEIFLRI